MESVQFSAGAPAAAGARASIGRVDELRWHAVEDDRLVGRGEAARRSDGRLLLSIDTWLAGVFDRLAAAMLADLSGPLSTLVDEADQDLTSRWERAGLTVRRREREYLLTTGPRAATPAPAGVAILPLGVPDQRLLREVHEAIRAEVEVVAPGWDRKPPSLVPPRYAVAAGGQRYQGLVRVLTRRRHARIELVAVRTGARRRGIARAMLAEVLGALHRDGVDAATADVDTANGAATALFEGLGARRVGGVVELGRG